MQEMKQMVKQHLSEQNDKSSKKNPEEAIHRRDRADQQQEWKERERHQRNTNNGSLLRK